MYTQTGFQFGSLMSSLLPLHSTPRYNPSELEI
jgi:hypothetical protein